MRAEPYKRRPLMINPAYAVRCPGMIEHPLLRRPNCDDRLGILLPSSWGGGAICDNDGVMGRHLGTGNTVWATACGSLSFSVPCLFIPKPHRSFFHDLVVRSIPFCRDKPGHGLCLKAARLPGSSCQRKYADTRSWAT